MITILAAALVLGLFTGLRTFTPVAVVCWAARLGWISLGATPLSFLGSTAATVAISLLAIGELIGDKLPWIPNRTALLPLIGRMLMGALCALVLSLASGQSGPWAIVAGVAGSLMGAFAGFHLRRSLVAKGKLPDVAVALGEDLIALGGSFLLLAQVF